MNRVEYSESLPSLLSAFLLFFIFYFFLSFAPLISFVWRYTKPPKWHGKRVSFVVRLLEGCRAREPSMQVAWSLSLSYRQQLCLSRLFLIPVYENVSLALLLCPRPAQVTHISSDAGTSDEKEGRSTKKLLAKLIRGELEIIFLQ